MSLLSRWRQCRDVCREGFWSKVDGVAARNDVMNSISFMLDLALALSIASVVHVILDPPITIDLNSKTTPIIPNITWYERLVLAAAALALVRLLHSYVLLKAQPQLRLELDNMPCGTRRQLGSLGLKFFIVVMLVSSLLVICHQNSRLVLSIAVAVPSAAVYFALFLSGSLTLAGLKESSSQTEDKKILQSTFESWVSIDKKGSIMFLLAIVYCLGASLSLDSLPTALNWMELGLFAGSIYLSFRDYKSNVKFYGLDLDFGVRDVRSLVGTAFAGGNVLAAGGGPPDSVVPAAAGNDPLHPAVSAVPTAGGQPPDPALTPAATNVAVADPPHPAPPGSQNAPAARRQPRKKTN
jgi:hypothetical protein